MAVNNISTTDTSKQMSETDFDPFEFGEIQCTVPSTESQHELWLSVQMGDDANCSFNESISLQLTGKLNVPAMQQALQALVDRHDAFRSTFSSDGSVFCINKSVEINTPCIDLVERTDKEKETELQKILDSEVETPFDLEHGPLVRAHIIKFTTTSFRLVFTAHHIVCDGWSMSCAIRDLGKLYSAATDGIAANLDEPYKFSDYSLLEQQEIGNQSNKAAESFWMNLYADGAPITDLPTDRARPLMRTYLGRREDLQLDPELVKALKRVGGKASCTFLTVLLAGFEAYLYRITGQDDFVVGIPAAGQSATGRSTLVGHCVNILPLRGQIKDKTKFSDLLFSVRSSMLDAYENQRYTFGSLIKKLPQNARDPGRIPLIPLLFNIDQATHEDGFVAEGMQADFFSNPRHFENFEWTLNVSSSATKVVFECTYNTNLFDNETIRRRLREYESVLRSIAADYEQGIDELDVLPASERSTILKQWNETDLDYDKHACLHDLISAQAELTPEAIAVIFEQTTLSYQKLNDRSNQLAHYLQQMGVGPEDLVGVALDRTEQMLIATLGVLKAGGGYVPMDPSYPEERLSYMLEHSGVEVLLSSRNLIDGLPKHTAKVVCIDSDWERIGKLEATQPVTAVKPEHIAYVIYTSGSTGKPKGVQVPHGSVVNFLNSMRKQPGLGAKDKLLAVTTLSFDIAVLELYLPLTVGAQVVIASKEAVSDGEQLLKTLQQHKITVMQATPASWRMLLGVGWQGGKDFKALVGGEALPRDLANELIDRADLWNMYGPTETTVWSTCEHITKKDGVILIGKPIDNTKLYVLNAHMQPVPIGLPGELYISGSGVTRGYLHDEEQTTERFISDPFSNSGARMYRTGDQVKYHHDGRLEYLSRLDNQVKIRGFRIELGEIESSLLTHPAVNEGVVITREDRPGDVRLVSYIVTTERGEVTAKEMRKYLRKSLPEYMIPQHVIELDAMPMTPNGKVDRKGLPSAMSANDFEANEYIAARGETEKALVVIWQDILHTDRVSINDNFFDLGGHSLLGIWTIARIKSDMGKDIKLVNLFEYPTIAELARILDDSTGRTKQLPPIVKRDSKLNPQLSITQQRLWYLNQLDPETLVYNLPTSFHIKGELDIRALEHSFSELARRHEVLRTTFDWEGELPVQKISSDFSFNLPVIKLKKSENLNELLQQDTNEQLSLTEGPLWRAKLYRINDTDHVLFFMAHHIIFDGWSFDIVIDELSSLYHSYHLGSKPSLTELPIQYADYAIWHREWMDAEEAKSQSDYWLNQLSGELPVLEMPTDFERPSVQTFNGSGEIISLTKEDAESLTTLARENGVTLYMLILAAYALLLSKYSGQKEIIIGSPINAREHPGTEQLIGFFVNTLLLRVKLDMSQGFTDLLKHIRDVCLGAFSHQEVPFEQLIKELDIPRDLSRNPIYQTLFMFQDARNRDMMLGDLALEQVNVNREGVATDLDFWVKQTNQNLIIGLEYNTDLFCAESIKAFLNNLQLLFKNIDRQPQNPISSLITLPVAANGEIEQKVDLSKVVRVGPADGSTDSETVIDEERQPQTISPVEGLDTTVTKASIEKTIVSLWEDVLDISDIEIFDNFFELGGHSLSSMQVLEKLRKQTGVRVPVRAILMDSLAQIVDYCYKEMTEKQGNKLNVSTDVVVENNTEKTEGTFKSRLFRKLQFLKPTGRGKK